MRKFTKERWNSRPWKLRSSHWERKSSDLKTFPLFPLVLNCSHTHDRPPDVRLCGIVIHLAHRHNRGNVLFIIFYYTCFILHVTFVNLHTMRFGWPSRTVTFDLLCCSLLVMNSQRNCPSVYPIKMTPLSGNPVEIETAHVKWHQH